MVFRKILEVQESLKNEKTKLSDTQYWIRFLQTTSHTFKQSFDDQIMINLHHPEFTACADARSWRSLGCEPKGHGVPTIHNGKIRFLFDITQVSVPENTPMPWVWEINDSQLNIDYSESVSKQLADKYNLDSETLEEQLYELTLMRTAKYLNDDKSDLFKAAAESAAYSVIYRCCPDEAQPSLKNLAGLSKYPIEEIGQAVSEISKSIFLEIGSIVRSTRHNAIEEIRRNKHNETRENDRRSETRSKSQDRGISSGYGNLKGMDVRSGGGEFSVLSDLSEGSSYRSDIGSGKERISGDGSGIGETIGGGERSTGLHGSGIRHSAGGDEGKLLQDGIGILETDSAGTASGDSSREVRDNAQELSTQSETEGIRISEEQRTAEQASDSRESSGARNGRHDNGKTKGEQSGIQASGESGRLSENSTASEQLSENSGGRNSDRTDIQIIGNTPYRYIPQKTYRKYDTETALKIADKLEEKGIKFSGKISAETTTITVSKADIERLEEIAHNISRENDEELQTETPLKEDFITFSWGEDKDWFTESDILSDFAEKNPEISFALANTVIGYLDEKQHIERNIPENNAGWYKKTDFTVRAVIDGQKFNYYGRFDIGDGKGTGGGSLIEHIRQLNEEIIKSDIYPYNTTEDKENARNTLDVLVPFLETHSVLTSQEQEIFKSFVKTNPIRNEAYIKANRFAEKSDSEKTETDNIHATFENERIHSFTAENEKFAIGELRKENPIDKAIRLINEYCKKEFDSPGNFANMDHIELAYEPDEETGLSGIEAYADLETFRIVRAHWQHSIRRF